MESQLMICAPCIFFVCFVSFVVPQKQLFNASREKQND
jgi:hypothetical protein